MRRVDNHYKYIAVYVDDLAIASKCPAGIIRALTEDYKFKLKGAGLISSNWDAISFVTKKVFHVSHLASTSISSLCHMSACLG
jgi:hypothetical protein